MSFTNWVTNRSNREEAGHLQANAKLQGSAKHAFTNYVISRSERKWSEKKCTIIVNMTVPRTLRYILHQIHLFQQLKDGLQETDGNEEHHS